MSYLPPQFNDSAARERDSLLTWVSYYFKGKSAIHIARVYTGRKWNYVGQHFWGRGYFVSTVGRDEQVIRDYIRHQENEDRRLEQMQLV